MRVTRGPRQPGTGKGEKKAAEGDTQQREYQLYHNLGEGSFQEVLSYFIGKLSNLGFKALAGALDILREAGSDVGNGLFGFFPR